MSVGPNGLIPPRLSEIVDFIAQRLPGAAADTEAPLRWRNAGPEADGRAIAHLLLALDNRFAAPQGPEPDLYLLHRPFLMVPGVTAPILAVHRAFDEHLALGWNVALAEVLAMSRLEPLFRERPDRERQRIGMIGDREIEVDWGTLRALLTQTFHGLELVLPGKETGGKVRRIAVVGAMTPDLIREARSQGAQVYITGQFRENARSAAQEAGLAVFAVGHRRSELWGLRRLAGEMEEAFPALTVHVAA